MTDAQIRALRRFLQGDIARIQEPQELSLLLDWAAGENLVSVQDGNGDGWVQEVQLLDPPGSPGRLWQGKSLLDAIRKAHDELGEE